MEFSFRCYSLLSGCFFVFMNGRHEVDIIRSELCQNLCQLPVQLWNIFGNSLPNDQHVHAIVPMHNAITHTVYLPLRNSRDLLFRFIAQRCLCQFSNLHEVENSRFNTHRVRLKIRKLLAVLAITHNGVCVLQQLLQNANILIVHKWLPRCFEFHAPPWNHARSASHPANLPEDSRHMSHFPAVQRISVPEGHYLPVGQRHCVLWRFP